METLPPPHGDALTRIVLTGSESVGKSTLGARLAHHYGALLVPEFVREFATQKGAPLDFRDHGAIARGQMALEDDYRARALARGDRVLFQDTDLTSTVVYCHHYFGRCPAFIEDAAQERRPALYLLLGIDAPWIADGVRDRGERREEMQALFADALARSPAPVIPIEGDWESRYRSAVESIDSLLATSAG